jgi:hypothetical protein
MSDEAQLFVALLNLTERGVLRHVQEAVQVDVDAGERGRVLSLKGLKVALRLLPVLRRHMADWLRCLVLWVHNQWLI